ncbi:MAG: hypothetical protein JAZ18_01855 [Candidatus Thiodiazotropha endolucinida]|nr:hypothetical protein [Candidatus Thiodiazotropha endolucinida]
MTKQIQRHTPGPWIQGNTVHTGKINIFNPTQTEAYHVGTFTVSRVVDPQWRANVRLVLAAPDMFEALESIANLVYECIDEQKRLDDKPMSYAQAQLLDYANEAIAIAQGEQ